MAKTKTKAKASKKSKKTDDLDDRFEDGDIDEITKNYDQDKAEREAFSGAGFFEWGTGDNNIRILPLRKGSGHPFTIETWVHFQIGPDERTFSCPRGKDPKSKCWICKRAETLLESQDDKDIEEGKSLRPKRRYLFNIYDRDDVDQGVQILEAGVTVYDDLMTYVRDDGWGKIWRLDDGYDVTVNKQGKKRRTKYKATCSKESTPIDDDIRALLESEELPDLNNIRKYASDDEMKAAYYGEDEDDDEEDDVDDAEDEEEDDDTPKKGKGKAPKIGSKATGKPGKPAKAKPAAKNTRGGSARDRVAAAMSSKKKAGAKKGKGKKKK